MEFSPSSLISHFFISNLFSLFCLYPCAATNLPTQLKKFKEEITLKQMERDRHVIAQQQMYSQMQNDLECECRKYRQMHEELMREKAEGDKRLYTLEGELFLSKMVEGDLAHKNEELRLDKSKADKLIVEAGRRAKKLKRSTMRHVLEAFQWKKDTADPVLLEAACAFWNALGARTEGEDYTWENERVSLLERKIAWKAITLKGWNGDMEKQLEAEFILKKRYYKLNGKTKHEVNNSRSSKVYIPPMGLLGVGERITKEFINDKGELQIFAGSVSSYKFEDGTGLYTVKFDDGDEEDLDSDDYADAHQLGLALTTVVDTEQSLQDKKLKAKLRPAQYELTIVIRELGSLGELWK